MQMATSAYLTYFKKLHKKIYFKKYHFVKQSLHELKAEEAKTGSNPTVVETADILVVEFLFPAVYPLPLADLFFFNSSFF